MRPSVGHFCAAASVRDDLLLDDPAVRALHDLFEEVVHGTPRGSTTVSARALVDLLPAYRNRVRGHAGVQSNGAHERAARALAAALRPAWDAGVFLPPGARLVFVETQEVDPLGGHTSRVLLLEGESSDVVEFDECPPSPNVLPGRVYVVCGGTWTCAHPWLLFRTEDLAEATYFFNGMSRRAEFLDYLGGDLIRGRELETSFPGTERELRSVFATRDRRAVPAPSGEAPRAIVSGVTMLLLDDVRRVLDSIGRRGLLEPVARRATQLAEMLSRASGDTLIESCTRRVLAECLDEEGRLEQARDVSASAAVAAEAVLRDHPRDLDATREAADAHLLHASLLFEAESSAERARETLLRAQDLADDLLAGGDRSMRLTGRLRGARALVLGARIARHAQELSEELGMARAAVRELESLWTNGHAEVDVVDLLVESLAVLGNALDDNAEHDKARESFDRARDVAERALDANPDDRRLARSLVGAHVASAVHLLWCDDYRGILDACRTGRDLLRRGDDDAPPSARETELHVWLDKSAAGALVATGDLESARRLAKSCVVRMERLAELCPSRWGAELAWCRMMQADTERRLGKPASATPHVEAAIVEVRSLLASQGRRLFLERYLARAHNLRASLMLELGRHREALESSRAAIGVCEQLIEASPRDLFALIGAFAGHRLAALALHDAGDPEQALAECELALGHCETIERIDPGVLHAEMDRGALERTTAVVLRGLGRPAEALPHAREAVRLATELLDAQPDNLLRRSALCDGLLGLGLSLRESGLHVDALQAFERALVVAEEVAAGDSSNAAGRWSVSRVQQHRAVTLEALGRRADAVASWRRAIAPLRHVAALEPVAIGPRDELAYMLRELAQLLRRMGHDDEAVAAVEEADALGADPQADEADTSLHGSRADLPEAE